MKNTDHFVPSGIVGAGRNAKIGQDLAWEGSEDELTNITVWVTVFGEVSFGLLQDCSQGSRVVNVSARAVRN